MFLFEYYGAVNLESVSHTKIKCITLCDHTVAGHIRRMWLYVWKIYSYWFHRDNALSNTFLERHL